MRQRVVPALTVLLWLGASGAGTGAETIAGPPTGSVGPPPAEVQASCNTIAAILSVYPTFVVGTSEGQVPGVRGGPERTGCRVRAAGPAWGLVGEVPPDWALRDLMGQLGWKEELRYAADDHGTTSFALRKERLLCLVTGGAPSGIEDGRISRAGTYELAVGCTWVDAPSMKQVLLNPRGFDMVWSCGGRSGWSRVFFGVDGKKIVAEITVVDIEDVDINNPENYGPERCTTEAKLTDNGVIFNGCRYAGRDIPLTYDPGNKNTPFKGSGGDCPRIELSPR